ncbi:M2 family metallopeptidase [Parvularcula sp. ZS-1/3]|uniref:M2 family metallopeptidase n=1 Tax=Parvularcula mediterranea TaxID=2732508 RepID=A0A7Y3RKA2_9PROT|nr:M2 family metallopeptidase [Parvularcula mediterranea]NNU15619.1 M2 family metallopeptidase [Parvularcula mediterranea]
MHKKLLSALLVGTAILMPLDASAQRATKANAEKFLSEAEERLSEIGEEASRIAWLRATYINYDSSWLEAKISAEYTELAVELANEASRYDRIRGKLTPQQVRKLDILKQSITLPAPTTDGAAARLAEITTRLDNTYATGTIELDGETIPQNRTETLMRELKDPAKLEEVWTKWRENSKPMKDDYIAMVDIANEGARELGYSDLGQMWRSNYDMDPDAFAEEVDRLWGQVKPLYDNVHCAVKYELNEAYGDDVVPLDQPIRADLLGNMWAQQWGSIYDLVKPSGIEAEGVDLDKLLQEADYTPLKIVETAEEFFTSLGFDELPETFWERSQITKPADRDVVCHASAWNLDDVDDIRIKMCTEVNADDFQTVHHELGHNIYQRAYNIQDPLFRNDPNDGFHEAIGDMVALSITPAYLQQIGLLDEAPSDDADLPILMQKALDGVAFLPFGLLVDKWRWQVFSGELQPDEWNEGWWALREEYQGIRPPAERPADAFDPGAKYHIPGNTPYMRYFLARILQFQFYKAACEQSGWEGPLHRCSFYGNEEVGTRFNAMLEKGNSQAWQDSLEEFTGTRDMDGSAMVEYFRPLMDYLDEANKDRNCGW